MPPELFISNQRLGWSKEILDLGPAPYAGELFRRRRQQVFEPDRILPDLTAGDMRREINRNGRPRVHSHQFVQGISAERRSSSGSALPTSEPSQPFPGRLPSAMMPAVAVSSVAASCVI